jgi:hypothetical protein
MSTYAPHPLNPEDVQGFLREKGVTNACPRCSKARWSIVEDTNMRGVAPGIIGDNGTPTGKVFPMLTLVCENCAFIWLMARTPVEAWVHEQPNK